MEIPNSYDQPMMVALAAGLLILLIIVLAIAVASYIFAAVGLYTMAKNRNLADKAFWAWIPYGRLYLMGLLARDTSIHDGTTTYLNMHVLLPVASAVSAFFILILNRTGLSFLGSLIGLAFSIIYLVCLYGLLKGYDDKNAAGTHIALSVFVPMYSSIIIFAFRNRPFLFGETEGSSDVGVPV
jgi:hypothetical protein